MKSRPRAAREVTLALLRAWPLPSVADSDSKEDRGRVLVVGGSIQVPGGVLLAATAALRAGAGKLQVATVKDAASALAIAIPEALVMPLPCNTRGDIVRASAQVREAAQQAQAIAIGSGMPSTHASCSVARVLLQAAKGTVLLDAGALGACRDSGNARPILTPHPGEMARLTDEDVDVIATHAAAIAAEFAADRNAIVVLKGPTTHIAHPDGRAWVHRGGVVGLGTSGSGDVLAGLIAGLAARGATPEQAAVWGVSLHARAGRRLSQRIGAVGFLAREIAAEVPSLLG
jgi:ADP-dependent NAD(P)H-hydrate dehydratase